MHCLPCGLNSCPRLCRALPDYPCNILILHPITHRTEGQGQEVGLLALAGTRKGWVHVVHPLSDSFLSFRQGFGSYRRELLLPTASQLMAQTGGRRDGPPPVHDQPSFLVQRQCQMPEGPIGRAVE